MNSFNSFGIQPKVNHFSGQKIDIVQVYNIEIIIHDYKIEPSKKKNDTNCLTLQIETGGVKRVIFSGSTILQQMIKEVPRDKFPFKTTIVKRGEFPEFT